MRDRDIPYGRQNITQEDIDAVVSTLKSDFLTQGPKVEEFETKFAHYIGSKYAVAVANGTAALHLSVLALGLEKGKKVITSPLTFVASANAVLYAGGEIDFCDIDPETLLLDIDLVREKLASSPKGTYCGIIPVDFAGAPVQMDAFRALADEYDLWILEDSCHAPGGFFFDATNKKQYCGNGNYADSAIFSFHPVKHIACGEGGMITTNDESLYKRLLKLRTHGITKNPDELKENHGPWYYEMQNLGYNYRLNDISCSLGISQLNRASESLKQRKRIAKKYQNSLSKIQEISFFNTNMDGHAYHLLVIKTLKRKALYNYLREHQILTQIHYIPVHFQPYYQSLGFKKGDFPNAEAHYESCLSLPIYPSITDHELAYTINTIKNFFHG